MTTGAKHGDGPSRRRRWLAVGVTLLAVPAIMATSPEHSPQTTTYQERVVLDAERPAAAFTGTIELDEHESEALVGVSVRTIADPDQPPVRAVVAPTEGGDLLGSSDQGDDGIARFSCGDPCRVPVRVVVELADDSGRPWTGVVELIGKGDVKTGRGEVRVSLAPDTERAAPTEAMAAPVASGMTRPPEQVAADVDPTLVARGRPPGPRAALAVRVSGPTDAVRQSQFALLADSRATLSYLGDQPGHEPSGSALAINPGARCTGPTCREEYIVSSEEGLALSVTSLTAPLPGVEVEVVEALGLDYGFDLNDAHVVTIPVPSGSDLVARATSYGYSSEDDDIPAKLRRGTGSAGEDIGGIQPRLVPVLTCPRTEPDGCLVTLEAEVVQGGTIDAFLLPTWD